MKKHSTNVGHCTGLPNAMPPLEQRLTAIEYRQVSDLKPYGRALRKHPEEQLIKLAASMRKFGYICPLLVDDEGTIIAGHARLEAAKRLGLTQIPVIPIAHLSKAEVKAFRLAEQRLGELATWDPKALILEIQEIIACDEIEIDVLGWETTEIDILLEEAQDAEVDPADDEVAPPDAPTTRPGDLWLLGKHRLLCRSSLDAEAWGQLMDGAQGAMSIVDPPFNVPVNGHVSGLGKVKHREFAMASGEMSETQFISFLAAFLQLTSQHLPDGAILHVFMDWKHTFELQSAARSVGLTLVNLCVWNKSNAGMGSLYRSKHELVLVFKKGKAPHRNNVELGRHGRYRTNVWDYAGANSFGRTRDQDLADHPTVKPVALVADAILDVTARGDIVLDAFMGSGTTILAAERTGRLGYGIEIDPAYVDVAIRRWETMTSQQAVLAGSRQSFSEVSSERSKETSEGEPANDVSEPA